MCAHCIHKVFQHSTLVANYFICCKVESQSFVIWLNFFLSGWYDFLKIFLCGFMSCSRSAELRFQVVLNGQSIEYKADMVDQGLFIISKIWVFKSSGILKAASILLNLTFRVYSYFKSVATQVNKSIFFSIFTLWVTRTMMLLVI